MLDDLVAGRIFGLQGSNYEEDAKDVQFSRIGVWFAT
jgi:hypothetical protein